MRLAVFLLPVLLAACSGEADEPGIVPERDPMATQALNDQIMVDPDLSQQNEANAALSGNGDHSLPPVVATREAIEGAKLEAADLVGGTANLRQLSEPKAAEPLPEAALYSVTELAKLTTGAEVCAEKASFTARWAARMPAALPIYPRGNTIEAAGSDSGGCKLRAVRFLTPVARADVLAFYAASARKAGLNASYSRAGEIEVVEGGKGASRYAIYVRRRQSGISEVGLVTSGF
ncbi:hypothetical protein LY632_11335 [Erythrobacter sp. SDW2]|uniref:hypothetical protein n=1 Tax=Erythrobacter sp. SDW2 TaxID=2907154 RepID=UPI001F371409|nr:hypothetical protein [Erythrobacter sp. SDW2]UIP06277.1 hypothetical protein LY632_11335 [Erythrobacter sp. SDW2]